VVVAVLGDRQPGREPNVTGDGQIDGRRLGYLMTIERWVRIPGQPAPFVRATGRQIQAAARSRRPNAQQNRILRYLAFKDSVGYAYKEQHAGEPRFAGPVRITVTVYLVQPDKRRWDVSNVLKAAEDGLNEIAYQDDRQVQRATIQVCRAEGEDRVYIGLVGEVEGAMVA